MDEDKLAEQWEQSLQAENESSNESKTDDISTDAHESTDDNIPQRSQATNFSELKKPDNSSGMNNLSLLLDIPLQISVQIGATRMIIKDLLQLGQGSIIELDKLAGEPMDVFVNDRLIAKGEVVVVNEKFGVRLTDIISPTEMVQQLK